HAADGPTAPARALQVAGPTDAGGAAGQLGHLLLVGPHQQHRPGPALLVAPVVGLADHLDDEPAGVVDLPHGRGDELGIPLGRSLRVDLELDRAVAGPGDGRAAWRGRHEGVAVATRARNAGDRV